MHIKFLACGAIPLMFGLLFGIPASCLATPALAVAPVAASLVFPPPKAGRRRPLVAIIAGNDGAQTTDLIIPYGVLKDSGVVDVRSVSTRAGAITLTRGLRIATDETIAEFDAREAAGADIVIVPAQADPKDAATAKWLRVQAAKGATIISVCEGARVLANAGLLDGRRATTHWASIEGMAKSYPATTWVRDRRYLQDGPVISTAGVTASIPMSLALVEAIGGHDAAAATASRFGVADWGAGHRTADFSVEKSDIATAKLARKAVREIVEIPIDDGIDEVSLALQAEAWGRSGRTRVATTRLGRMPIRSRHGLVILPDAEAAAGSHVVPTEAMPAMPQFEATLAEMERRYGTGASRLATLAMEYDAPPTAIERAR